MEEKRIGIEDLNSMIDFRGIVFSSTNKTY